MNWIDVKNRLTENADTVLGYDSYADIFHIVFYSNMNWYSEEVANALFNNVTHWQLLPEAPE